MRVVMSGGGTAGHVFPALAVAERLRGDGHEVRFVGSAEGQEAELVPAAGFAFMALRVASAQTRVSARTLRAAWLSLAAARAVRPLVRSADAVVGIGGFASAPAIWAARRTHTPIVLIEQNGVPGLVNRVAARWARVVATTFETATGRFPSGTRIVRTGNPIRRSIAEVASERADPRRDALVRFALEPDRCTVGVFGGSQGALRLDRLVASALGRLRDRRDLQFLVACGPGRAGELEAATDDPGRLVIRVEEFIDRMDLALAVTDLAVSRAGSGTLAELSACGVPAILVPYPHATENHQESNARELEAAGGAEVVLEAELTPSALAERMTSLVDDGPRRESMAASMRAWSRPDADARIAQLVVEAAA